MESSAGNHGVEQPSSRKRGVHRIAWWISVVAHPFVMLLVYVLVVSASTLPVSSALAMTGLVFAVAVLPMLVYIARLVRAGASNFDVSLRERRGPVYLLGLTVGAILVGIFVVLEAPRETFWALGSGMALVAAASLVNLRLKVSLHSAFAGWVAVALGRLEPGWIVVLLAVTVVVAWSRLVLQRHTMTEVVVGSLLGVVFAAPLIWLG